MNFPASSKSLPTQSALLATLVVFLGASAAAQTTRTAVQSLSTPTQGTAALKVDQRGVPSGAMLLGDSPQAPPSYSATGMTLAVDTGIPNWAARARIPMGIEYPGSASVPQLVPDKTGDSWFIAGGTELRGAVDSLFEYQAGLDVWIQRAPMPGGGRSHLELVYANGLLYAIGGLDANGAPTDRVEAFDPATNTWSDPSNPLPVPLTNFAAAVQNGVIHVLGGSSPLPPFGDGHFTWDPISGGSGWAVAASLPSATTHHTAVTTSDGTIVVAGGLDPTTGLASNVVQFLSVGGTWQIGNPLPVGIKDHTAAVVGACIYLLGGTDSMGAAQDTVITSINGKSWSLGTPLRENRFGPAAASLNGQLFVAAGSPGGMTWSPNVDAYHSGRKMLYVHRKN